MTVGAVAFTATTLVHDEILEPELYVDALAENEVYRRVYADVLTDPAVREVTNGLLGGFDIGGRDLADTVALSNALVRLALPPDVLADVGEQIVTNVLAYLRGDTARLDTTVTLVGALERLDASASVVVRDVLTDATSELLTNLDHYERAVREFADELAAGTIPTSIPIVGGDRVSEAEIIAAIDEATRFGLPAAVRDQVMAAVRSGQERDALISAAATLSRSHLTALSAALAAGDELQLDYIEQLGDRSGNPQHATVARLNSLRDGIERFPAWIKIVGVVLVLAGASTLVIIDRRRWRVAVAAVGAGLIVAGVATWSLWQVATDRFESPLVSAASPSGSRTLPASVARILADVDATLAGTLAHAVQRVVSVLLTFGVLALGAVVAVVLASSLGGERRPLATGAVAGTAIVVAAVVWVLPETSPPDVVRECNGHRELCDRPYDEVVQAATHNAMSSPDVVRIWPEHDADIRTQLDFGIRALMIDSKYWTGIDTPAALSTADQLLRPDVAASLFRALGSRTDPRPGTFLCHSRCAYGAIPFAVALGTIATFLDENPDEVVTLIIQDEVTTEDTAAAFALSGIDRYVYDGESGGPWPTLGSLIDRGERLVVFSENAGPPPPWYHRAFDLIQETPFRTRSADALTCAANRGPLDASLFLMNHWVQREAPDRADAVVVNSRRFIVDRALRCQEERGQLPDFVAVNFFAIGDVIGAVDELNGL